MKVKSLFETSEKFSIKSYLKKSGIKNIEKFINPDESCYDNPINYKNILKGFDLITESIDNGAKIGILVDVDFDGYASASIVAKWLKEFGVESHIIFHKSKVHGIDEETINEVLYNDIELLIIPDAGTNDIESHKILNDNGVSILILDHHQSIYSIEELTVSNNWKLGDTVVINDKLSDALHNTSPSGALVTLKFLQHCDAEYQNDICTKLNLEEIAYFSLISDIMDMRTLENRYISSKYKKRNDLKHPLFLALVDEFIREEEFTNTDITFKVVPKLSAIIRYDDINLKLLLFDTLVNPTEDKIKDLIKGAKSAHSSQQRIVKSYVEENKDSVVDRNIIIEETDIKSDFRGLVASKYCEMFGRPVLLYSIKSEEDYATVSLRANYEIKDFINSSGLIELKGHDSACGGIIPVELLPKLIDWCETATVPEPFFKATQSFKSDEIPIEMFDCYTEYSDIFGRGIPEPKFHIMNFTINSGDIMELGRNKTTLKFVHDGVDYIKFFCSKKDKEDIFRIGKNKDLNVEIIGNLTLNEWNGTTTPQCIIDRIEAVEIENTLTFDDIF